MHWTNSTTWTRWVATHQMVVARYVHNNQCLIFTMHAFAVTKCLADHYRCSESHILLQLGQQLMSSWLASISLFLRICNSTMRWFHQWSDQSECDENILSRPGGKSSDYGYISDESRVVQSCLGARIKTWDCSSRSIWRETTGYVSISLLDKIN